MVSQRIYKNTISAITDFKGIEQRVQVTIGENIYDIVWDSVNERVIVYEGDDNWCEICHNDVEPISIRLIDVMQVLNCVSEDTFPILDSYPDDEYSIDNYLVTPISIPFLIQIEVVYRNTRGAVVENEIEAVDEDPSGEECNDDSDDDCDDDCDDPSSSEEEV